MNGAKLKEAKPNSGNWIDSGDEYMCGLHSVVWEPWVPAMSSDRRRISENQDGSGWALAVLCIQGINKSAVLRLARRILARRILARSILYVKRVFISSLSYKV